VAGNFNLVVDEKSYELLKQNIDLFDKKTLVSLEKGVAAGALIIANDIKNDIRSRAKEQTGKLESSIGVQKFSSRPGYVSYDAGYVNTDPKIWSIREDRYFVYWEIGSSRQEPRHSATRAKRKLKGEVMKTVEESIFEMLNGLSFK
jgi:hypothetical protein